MKGKNITFNDKKINNSNFYRTRAPFIIDDIDINKILISKKDPYGKKGSPKHFIWYNDDDAIRLLCIKLTQIIGYLKDFGSDKTMSFKAIDNKLFKKVY